MVEYEQFIQPKKLKQVNHVWNTYTHGTINTSVAAPPPRLTLCLIFLLKEHLLSPNVRSPGLLRFGPFATPH